MKQIKATIVYPVDVKISVPEKSSPDFIWEALVKAADNEISSSSVAPVIHSCSESNLVSHGVKRAELSPETQADWVQGAIQGLMHAKENVSSAIIARPFLLKMKTKDGRSLYDKITMVSTMLKELVDEIIAATNPTKPE